jgi:hypothetical protein
MKFNPVARIGDLGAPGKTTFVMKEGVVYKDER